MPGDLDCGRSAVEDHDLAIVHHGSCCLANRLLFVGRNIEPGCEIAHRWRGGKRSAVDALQEALGGELAEIAANCVFGESELFAQIFCDDLAGLAKYLKEMLFAMACEHSSHYRIVEARNCTKMHEIAHLCTF